MSGHSKWSQIKRQKGAADKKRGQLFSKLSNLITVAARHGGDPGMNQRLRIVVEQARAENMPRDVIDRAIKRGTGELAGKHIEEFRFEAYGPGGVGMLIDGATDNRNRATSDVKAVLNRLGGKLATSGAVAYQFLQRGLVTVPISGQPLDRDSLELAIIEASPESYEDQGDALLLITDPKQLAVVKERLAAQNINTIDPKLSWEPTQTQSVTDAGTASQILQLMDALEDLEDVTAVTANFDIPSELMQRIS